MLSNHKFWFKAGAWALVVTACLHSLSLVRPMVGENDTERQLIELMTTYKLGSIDRTMHDLFFFFSLTMTLMTLFIALLDLLFARFYMPSAHERRFLAANAVFWTAFLVPLWVKTFIVPFTCYAVCAGCFLLAFFLHKKE